MEPNADGGDLNEGLKPFESNPATPYFHWQEVASSELKFGDNFKLHIFLIFVYRSNDYSFKY